MLPAAKINQDIADARGLGEGPWGDCYSPSRHSSFSNPTEMLEFIQKLRELSGGKPGKNIVFFFFFFFFFF